LSDPIYDAAVAKRENLLKDLEKINNFLEAYQTIAVELKLEERNKKETQIASQKPVNSVDSEQKGGVKEEKSEVPRRSRVTDNPKPSDVVAAAAEVIREKGRPMSRRSIHKALAEQGIVVNGADPVKALGTMLWRSGKEVLVQIEGRGYGLKGVEYKPLMLIRKPKFP